MTEHANCPRCGQPLPAHAPAGLCPKCLIRAGFESEAEPFARPAATIPSPANSRFEPLSVESLAGKFPQLEILELLGKGGMGAVYKARQRGLDRLVAVKVLPPEIGHDPAFAERFTREARALARLSHNHIVSVFDFGQSDGLFYIVMEYVDGVNLRQTIQAGKLTPAEALAIVPQICEALQFAHDEGIVHRDIKPENILIDKRGRVKIADFGLAKLMASGGRESPDGNLTATHQIMGTLRYMAPEQMQGTREVDHRADIYSLGVIFYELLTGDLPMGKFAPPSQRVQIDVRLDEIVLRALEQQPEQRYQHASDIKTDVDAISRSPKSLVGTLSQARDEWWAARGVAAPKAVSDGLVFRRLSVFNVLFWLVWSALIAVLHWGYLSDAKWYFQKELPYNYLSWGWTWVSLLFAFFFGFWWYLLAKVPETPRSWDDALRTLQKPDRRAIRLWLPGAAFTAVCIGAMVVTMNFYDDDVQSTTLTVLVIAAPLAVVGSCWWAFRERVRELLRDQVPPAGEKTGSAPVSLLPPAAHLVQAPADCLLLAAGIALATACGVAIWLLVVPQYSSDQHVNSLVRGGLTTASGVHAFYAVFIGAAGLLLRQLRARLFVLLVVVVVGLFLPAVIALNVVMEFRNMPTWPVAIPLWLGVPVAMAVAATLFRDDVRRAFAAARQHRVSNRSQHFVVAASEPRLSLLALVGILWAPLPLLGYPAWHFAIRRYFDNAEAFRELNPAVVLVAAIILALGATAFVGTTILGFVAIEKIKRSEERLYGLRLAQVDALLFPLLLLAAAAGFASTLIVLTAIASGADGRILDKQDLPHLMIVAIAIPIWFFPARALWRFVVGPQDAFQIRRLPLVGNETLVGQASLVIALAAFAAHAWPWQWIIMPNSHSVPISNLDDIGAMQSLLAMGLAIAAALFAAAPGLTVPVKRVIRGGAIIGALAALVLQIQFFRSLGEFEPGGVVVRLTRSYPQMGLYATIALTALAILFFVLRFVEETTGTEPASRSRGLIPGLPETHVRFLVSDTSDVARQAKFHFSTLGYHLLEEGPDACVFERGNKWAGLWAFDIRKLHTILTVRTAPAAGGGLWVSCNWSLRKLGSWVFPSDIAKLDAEGRGLESLLTPKKEALAGSSPPAAPLPPAAYPKLVPVLAVFNLVGAIVLMLVCWLESPAEFARPVPRHWQVWEQVDMVLAFAMAAGMFAASIGLFLWKPWARKLTLGVCIFGLASLVFDAPYLARYAILDLYTDIEQTVIAEGVEGDVRDFVTLGTFLLVFGGSIAFGLACLIGQVIYFTRPRVVAAFESQGERYGRFIEWLFTPAGAVVGVLSVFGPLALVVGIAAYLNMGDEQATVEAPDAVPPLGTIGGGIGVSFTVPAGQVAVFEIVTRQDNATVPLPPHCGYVMASGEPLEGTFRWSHEPEEIVVEGGRRLWRIETRYAGGGKNSSGGYLLPEGLDSAVGSKSLGLGLLEPSEEIISWCGNVDATKLPANGAIGVRITVVPHGMNKSGSGAAHIDWKREPTPTMTRRKLP